MLTKFNFYSNKDGFQITDYTQFAKMIQFFVDQDVELISFGAQDGVISCQPFVQEATEYNNTFVWKGATPIGDDFGYMDYPPFGIDVLKSFLLGSIGDSPFYVLCGALYSKYNTKCMLRSARVRPWGYNDKSTQNTISPKIQHIEPANDLALVDWQTKFEELYSIVENAVSRNPTTVDSKLADYIEENPLN